MVPSPENVNSAMPVEGEPAMLRGIVASLGERTLGMYVTAKEYSPVDIPTDLEQSVVEFAKNKYCELGDPLVTKLDSTFETTEKYIRTTVEVTKTQVTETYESAESYIKDNVITPYSEAVVAPTEEYIKYAKEFIEENKTVVVEKVQTSVIQPYNENIYEPTEKILSTAVETARSTATETYASAETFIKEKAVVPATETYTVAEAYIKDKAIQPTEQYIKSSVQLAQDRVRETEDMLKAGRDSLATAYATNVVAPTEELLNNTWTTVMDTADKAIDFLLPEIDESGPATPPSASEELSVKTKKIAARLRRAAGDAVAHSQERISEIVHVDLIAYAKETVGADDKKLADVFDKVVSALPNTESTDKLVETVLEKIPAQALPIVKTVTEHAVPVVNFSLDLLVQSIVLLRGKVIPTDPASTTPALQSSSPQDEFKDAHETLPVVAPDDDDGDDDDDDGDDQDDDEPVVQSAEASVA